MSIPLDDFTTTEDTAWLQRGRGGFLRDRHGFGAPHITCPTGANVNEPGLKADLIALCDQRGIDVPDKVTVAQLHEMLGPKGPKRLAYGSPSKFGDLIEDPEAIVNYQARMGLRGIGNADREYRQQLLAFADADPDDAGFKNEARKAWSTLQKLGGSNIAPDRGTLVHAAIHARWQGLDWAPTLNDDGVTLGVEAVALGLGLEAVDQCLDVFFAMVADAGLEILVMEAPCVNDTYRQAGTLDCIARATKDVTIDDVHIPAGWVGVVDIKTGKMRT